MKRGTDLSRFSGGDTRKAGKQAELEFPWETDVRLGLEVPEARKLEQEPAKTLISRALRAPKRLEESQASTREVRRYEPAQHLIRI